ncbi:MAG: creatininase family protein, partial [Candidatus Omnitrophica bacterium]|nr:creatininase family protein [Candidatus Omnitrophota bacterium]
GVGGLDEPHTFVMDPEDSTYSQLLRPWLEKLCMEAKRNGFHAVILLTGHYGAAQQIVVRETAVRMSRLLDLPILGTPEYLLALDEGYLGDHAAWGETSLMMHLDPSSVDLSRLGEEPHQGVHGKDPKAFATEEDGERISKVIIDRLGKLSLAMPCWDADQKSGFIRAEEALVSRQQFLAGREGVVWAAWKNIEHGALKDYGRFLVDEAFDQIRESASQL